MIKAKIKSIDLNTGIGICILESQTEEIEFNVLKLQNGHLTNLYNLKIGMDVFFDEDIFNNSKIDSPYYLEDLSEKFSIVKKVYSNQDRLPLIGDYVKTKSEGIKRIARVDNNIVQLGYGKPYLFMDDAGASYSGGLEYPINAEKLKDSGEMDFALFWTFKDLARAHNGIDFELKVKVWFLEEES